MKPSTTLSLFIYVLTLCSCGGGGSDSGAGERNSNLDRASVRSGYMLQGVFDSTPDSNCKQGQKYCVNGAFPIDEAIARLCSIPQPVFSVAWKAYGDDIGNFHRLVSGVVACNPNVVVRVSFEQGPSRPPRFWRGYWTFAGELSVSQFNRAISSNGTLRDRYRDYLASIRAETVDRYPDTHFIFFGIEDNWTCEAFGAVYELWADVFGDRSTAEFMRNPVSVRDCPLDREFRYEVHGPVTPRVLENLRAGDIYCPDGAYHARPSDNLAALQPTAGGAPVASYDEALALAQTMRERGIWFEAWYPELQAVRREDVARYPSPPPMQTNMHFLPWEEDRRIFAVHQGAALQ